MTKEDLDQQIVEKKLAKLPELDHQRLKNLFEGNVAVPHLIKDTVTRLIELNMAKISKALPEWGIQELVTLTKWGILARQKLKALAVPKKA